MKLAPARTFDFFFSRRRVRVRTCERGATPRLVTQCSGIRGPADSRDGALGSGQRHHEGQGGGRVTDRKRYGTSAQWRLGVDPTFTDLYFPTCGNSTCSERKGPPLGSCALIPKSNDIFEPRPRGHARQARVTICASRNRSRTALAG